MRVIIILAFCTCTLARKRGHYKSYETTTNQYPNAPEAQTGRNFAENPVLTLDSTGTGLNIDNKYVPGYNPYDPARHEPGYFPEYSNRHLDNLNTGPLPDANSNPTLVSSYSAHSGGVTIDHSTSVSGGQFNKDPQTVYTENSHNVYQYDGRNGPGLTETKTSVNYVPTARDISTYSQSYPGGDVVITSNHPARDNGKTDQSNRDYNPYDTSAKPRYNTRHGATRNRSNNNGNVYNKNTATYDNPNGPGQFDTGRNNNGNRQNVYNKHTATYDSPNGPGQFDAERSNNGNPQNVYTKHTKDTTTYDSPNGPGQIDTETKLSYIPSNRDISVQRVPYDGGEMVITKNRPVNNYNTGNYDYNQPEGGYNQASRDTPQYDSRGTQDGYQPTYPPMDISTPRYNLRKS